MSTLGMVGRLAFAMAVVVGVMWVAGRVLRNRQVTGTGRVAGGRHGARPATIDVLARRGLSKGAAVAVVRAGGRTLVLGVTDSTVTLLGEAEVDVDDGAVAGADPGGPPPPGVTPGVTPGGLVDALKELTVRRP